MHAPAAVTAAEQEDARHWQCACVRRGWVPGSVGWYAGVIGNSRLCCSSARAAIQRAKTGKRKHHHTTEEEQEEEEGGKKSLASGRSAQTTDSKMNLPRTPNTSHPPAHHTHHTRPKPARKPPITTRTAHTHPPPVWRRGRASPLCSPPVPPPNGSALARGARRATGARALAVQSCCFGPWRGGEPLALREQGGAVAGVWQRWWAGGGPGSASVSASASGQRVAGCLVVLVSLLGHGHVQRVCKCV
jgi:hypothetical protein